MPAARWARTPRSRPTRRLPIVFAEVVGQFVDHLVRTAAEPPWKGPGRFPSLHDQWAHALRSTDGLMKGDAAELAQLAEQVRTWRRPIDVAASAPFRLCFRLEEPTADTGKAADRWRVNYLLQAVNDLSLLVPAEAAWQARGKEAQVLGRDGFRPREYLLAALGQAATLSPPDRGQPEGRRARGLRPRHHRARTRSSRRRPGRWSRRDSASSCPPGGPARGPSCGCRPARSSPRRR